MLQQTELLEMRFLHFEEGYMLLAYKKNVHIIKSISVPDKWCRIEWRAHVQLCWTNVEF